MREYGSEFWKKYETNTEEKTDNVEYLLSGRTALDFILKDILCSRIIKTAMLPAYCCDSMIEPFIRNGIDVIFYRVDSFGIYYPYNANCDVVLLLDYFGYETDVIKVIARAENKSGKIVIYDSTHKLNGNPKVEEWAHYSFCSYRKWFYCNCAKAIKHKGIFAHQIKTSYFKEYIKLRDKAAKLKSTYISGETQEKAAFLMSFVNAEKMIERRYENFEGLPVKIPLQEIIRKRQENSVQLIKQLKRCPDIKLLNPNIRVDDAPLFVPILVPADKREALRKYLIEKKIFCPIHWPKTSLQKIDSDLYDRELSLVCDQRYTICDMDYIADEVGKFFCK